MTSACAILTATRIRQFTDKRLLPFVIGLGLAAVARFVMLAPGAMTVFTGRPLPFRPDELRIGNLIGVPANALLFAELLAAIFCGAFLLWRMPGPKRALANTGVVTGVVLGWMTWFTTGVVFGIRMML